MSRPSYAQITRDGLWHNNVGMVQLLGLCPLLAVTGTAINGLGLGLATLLTLVLSNGLISAIRNLVRPEVRIPVFVLVIASVVTIIELLVNAYLHQLYLALGIFLPLIVTNCSIIGRAEAFAAKQPLLPSLLDGLTMGLGFAGVLVLLGALREIIGHGTLFDQSWLLFGERARDWTLTLIPDYPGFLLAILPPGAFIGLGLIIAAKNAIDARRKAHPEPAVHAEPAPA